MSSLPAAGQLIGGRYRLERLLSGSTGPQGDLWLASDSLASDAPAALRRLGPEGDPLQARQLWARLQGVMHPQVPRVGAAISEGDDLWLVREWQAGRTYQQLLTARQERQLVFGAGEVLLLLRQLLPVLVALHSQDLLHGDVTPANVLRRDRDGLPVLLDFGLLRGPEGGVVGGTPGYAPPELLKGASPEPWMDLHALGVLALVLLSGDPPERLLDPHSLAWRWPPTLDDEPALRQQLERLVSRDPSQRFATAAAALRGLQTLAMPDSTGPVPRADRTVVLVPAPPAADPGAPPESAATGLATAQGEPAPAAEVVTGGESPAAGAAASEHEGRARRAPAPVEPPSPPRPAPSPPPEPQPPPAPSLSPARARQLEREEQAEGRLWPVLMALVLSAVAGTALGWWWLGRGGAPSALPGGSTAPEAPSSLPPGEVDQREQLVSRLRAMQVDRDWFLQLVNASLLAQYPERRGRLPSDSLEDAPLRKAWNALAEDWLARVEQLPLAIRRRLGSFSAADWDQRQRSLAQQGLGSEVLRQLVSGSAQSLLPGRASGGIPEEPFRQLWYAAALQTLDNLSIEPIDARPQVTQLLAADVPANGARLFPIRLPLGHALVLGVNGTPLLQMSVYAADGRSLAPRGPLRVVNLGTQEGSPVQLLVTNEGVAPSRISLSLRADPPPPTAEAPPAPPSGTAPESGAAPSAPPADASGATPPTASPAESGPSPAPESAAPASGKPSAPTPQPPSPQGDAQPSAEGTATP
ncbi:MAG: serine/threonine protein kinase [Cyanobacteriota bacterium]|nr:serine/threonine protein kinase [Cyanobacteriota bacterium]